MPLGEHMRTNSGTRTNSGMCAAGWSPLIYSMGSSPGEEPVTWESSFSNLSDTSPMSQLILQHFHHFTYITVHSPTLLLLHLHHSSFSNPSFASPTSQALHLASQPWYTLFETLFPSNKMRQKYNFCCV